MPKFTVFFSYQMAGEIEVDASTIEEAMTLVDDMPNLPPAEYVDSSFEVDASLTYDMNENAA